MHSTERPINHRTQTQLPCKTQKIKKNPSNWAFYSTLAKFLLMCYLAHAGLSKFIVPFEAIKEITLDTRITKRYKNVVSRKANSSDWAKDGAKDPLFEANKPQKGGEFYIKKRKWRFVLPAS